MQPVIASAGGKTGVLWCGECGTIQHETAVDGDFPLVPRLVGRCHEFECGNLHASPRTYRVAQWDREISRSIHNFNPEPPK